MSLVTFTEEIPYLMENFIFCTVYIFTTDVFLRVSRKFSGKLFFSKHRWMTDVFHFKNIMDGSCLLV